MTLLYVTIAWNNKPLLLLTTALLPNRTTEFSKWRLHLPMTSNGFKWGCAKAILFLFISGVTANVFCLLSPQTSVPTSLGKASISFGNVFRQFAVIFLGYQNSWLVRTAMQPWICAPASPLKACTTYREGRLTSFMVFQNIYHFGDAKVPKNWRSFCACPKKIKPEVALWNSVY